MSAYVNSSVGFTTRSGEVTSQMDAVIHQVKVEGQTVVISGVFSLTSGPISVAVPTGNDLNPNLGVTASVMVTDDADNSNDTFMQRVVSCKVTAGGYIDGSLSSRVFSTTVDGTGYIRKGLIKLRWTRCIPDDTLTIHPGFSARFEIVLGKIDSTNKTLPPTHLSAIIIAQSVGRLGSLDYTPFNPDTPYAFNGMNISIAHNDMEDLRDLEQPVEFENVRLDMADGNGVNGNAVIPSNVVINGILTINVPSLVDQSIAAWPPIDAALVGSAAPTVDNFKYAGTSAQTGASAPTTRLPVAGEYYIHKRTATSSETVFGFGFVAQSIGVYAIYLDNTSGTALVKAVLISKTNETWDSSGLSILPSLEVAGVVAGGVEYWAGTGVFLSTLARNLTVSGCLIGVPRANGKDVAFLDFLAEDGLLVNVNDSVLRLGGAMTSGSGNTFNYVPLPFIRSTISIYKSGIYVPIESTATVCEIDSSRVDDIKLATYKNYKLENEEFTLNILASDIGKFASEIAPLTELVVTSAPGVTPVTYGTTTERTWDTTDTQFFVENANFENIEIVATNQESLVFSSFTTKRYFDVRGSSTADFTLMSDGSGACKINVLQMDESNSFLCSGRIEIDKMIDIRSSAPTTQAAAELIDCQMFIKNLQMEVSGNFFVTASSSQNSTVTIGLLEILNTLGVSSLSSPSLPLKIVCNKIEIRSAIDYTGLVTSLVLGNANIKRFLLNTTAAFTALTMDNSSAHLVFETANVTATPLTATNHIYKSQLTLGNRIITAVATDCFDNMSSFTVPQGSKFNYDVGMKVYDNTKECNPPDLIIGSAAPSGVATNTIVELPVKAKKFKQFLVSRTSLFNTSSAQLTIDISISGNGPVSHVVRPRIGRNLYKAKLHNGYTALSFGAIMSTEGLGPVT
jgi:hypothetical protein